MMAALSPKTKKRTAKSSITKLDHLLSNEQKWSLGMVQAKKAQLLKNWDTFSDAWQALNKVEQEADKMEEMEAEFIEVHDKMEELEAKLTGLEVGLTPTPVPPSIQSREGSPRSRRSISPNSVAASAAAHALPKISLPKLDFSPFTGKYEEWSTFKDIFTALIHNNPKDVTLEDVTKFQYLLSMLTNEPKSLLSRTPVTSAEYEGAWDILKDRYENRKIIVFEHLKTLLTLKQVSQDSAKSLRELMDTMTLEIRSLGNFDLKLEGNDFEDIIVCYLAIQRLDSKTYELWNMAAEDKELPKWDNLKRFLERRCRDLESREGSKEFLSQQEKGDKSNGNSGTHSKGGNKCSLCSELHQLYKCQKYAKLNLQERRSTVYGKGLCGNCLHSGHKAFECTSNSMYRQCGKGHHSSLHEAIFVREVSGSRPTTQSQTHTGLQVLNEPTGPTPRAFLTVLPTAVVRVKDARNRFLNCRALIDQAAQVCCITEECVAKLGLTRSRSDSTLQGLGGQAVGKVKGEVKVDFKSMFNNFNLNVEALILPKLTGLQPQQKIDMKSTAHLRDIQFADPTRYQPGKVDLLLDAGAYGMILRGGLKRHGNGPIAQETELG